MTARTMELDGKTVVVVGLAQTGIAVARFCARRGARVIVTDGKPADRLGPAIAQLDGVPVRFELGGLDLSTFLAAELVVMSPGVPPTAETRAARAAGIEVIAEIELAYRFLHPDAALVAITGTNGKSTTTALTGALLEATGRPTFCGGNLGNMPLIDAVDHPANIAGGYVVAEVAAFMLENCTSFAPRVGVLTNITEDHLDRFGTIEHYADIKGRIWDFQADDAIAVANADDPRAMAQTSDLRSRLFTFDARPGADARLRAGPGTGAFVSDDRSRLVLRMTGQAADDRVFPVDDLAIVGTHNLENAMCAYLAAAALGVPDEVIRAGARGYRPLPHRMERIGHKGDIQFYDDSKGTNVASVAASVRGFPRPLALIAGGVDKGGSYAPMLEALGADCRGLVLIGAAAPLIRAAAVALGVRYPVVDAVDMHDAVRRATGLCRPGDAVVLSPACASYDMFDNFGHRGRVFREAAAAAGATRTDDANR